MWDVSMGWISYGGRYVQTIPSLKSIHKYITGKSSHGVFFHAHYWLNKLIKQISHSRLVHQYQPHHSPYQSLKKEIRSTRIEERKQRGGLREGMKMLASRKNETIP